MCNAVLNDLIVVALNMTGQTNATKLSQCVCLM